MISKQFKNINEYIRSFPLDVQVILKRLRQVIQEAAPGATEAIKYQMPTFVLNGNLVHFAGYKNHIGFYPIPTAIRAFKDKLLPYKTAKGSIQFPLDKPLPLNLIKQIVRFRVRENLAKTRKKA